MDTGKYVNQEELDSFPIVPGVLGKSSWGNDIMLTFIYHEPNQRHGTHTHTFEQAGIIISGEKYIQIGDESRLLQPGDAYIVPAGVEHGSYTTESACVNMDIFTPPRDDYKKP